jgi:hypothetical protein
VPELIPVAVPVFGEPDFEMDTNVIEPPLAAKPGEPAQPKKRRPGSAVTSGRKLFIGGDPNSAWSRRYRDLCGGLISDLGGRDMLSQAQLSLCRRAAALTGCGVDGLRFGRICRYRPEHRPTSELLAIRTRSHI